MKITPGNAQDIGAHEKKQNSFCFSNSVDARFVDHAGRLAVVADGAGGSANSGNASSLAARSFLREYESKRAPESIPAALQFSLAAAFRAVGALDQSAEAGSSLMAAVVCQDLLYWISVGDSHIYLLRDGELAQLNREQKMRDAVAQGSFSLSQAGSHPEHKHLTSYLGIAKPSEVDCNVRPLALRESDRVILCSNSVYRLIGANGIAQVLQEPPSAASESTRRKVLSLRHKNQNDLTILALRCGEEQYASFSRPPNRWVRPTLAVLLALNLCFGWNVRREWITLRSRQSAPTVSKQMIDKAASPQSAQNGKFAKQKDNGANHARGESRSVHDRHRFPRASRTDDFEIRQEAF